MNKRINAHRLFKIVKVFKGPHPIWPLLVTSIKNVYVHTTYTCTSTYANTYTFIISLSSLTISIPTSFSMYLYRYKCLFLIWALPTTDLGYLGVSSVTATTAVSTVNY